MEFPQREGEGRAMVGDSGDAGCPFSRAVLSSSVKNLPYVVK